MPAPAAPRLLSADVLTELRRVDRLACERARAIASERPSQGAELRGLFISDRDLAEMTATSIDQTGLRGLACTEREGMPQSGLWFEIMSAFGLTALEGDILLLALLPEVDLRYERIYAYLNDDVTARHFTVDLALSLLCFDLSSRLALRASFAADAPLLRYGLITLTEREGSDSILSRTIQLEADVVSRFLWTQDVPTRLPARLSRAVFRDDGTFVPDEQLEAAIMRCSSLPADAPRRVHIVSGDVWAARQVAARLCSAWGRPLIYAEPAMDRGEQESCVYSLRVAQREALFEDAALGVILPSDTDSRCGVSADQMAAALAAFPNPVLWMTADEAVLLASPEAPVARLRLLPLTYPQRLMVWERSLDASLEREPTAVEAVAGRFRLNGEQIVRASRLARDTAWQRDPSRPAVSFDDLAAASRSVSTSTLGELASRIEPAHCWDDLVLAADRIAQLREMCDQFIYRPLVLDAWGFAARSSLGRGLSALFAGASGTGKTMAAEVVARELGLDLYKIDLSGVVSKYIGETEKNLERIFDMARDSNAILLFDEADALFGKRSETKDAHDRYANIEISYLLQKIEEYDGVVILTSNLRQNLDEAFLRRLQFSVEFPMPDEEARRAIWQRCLPGAAPLAGDVDLATLAHRFRFAGGSIRNVCVNAAFLAARDGRVVGMEHLLWAARREFQKLGKLVDEAAFSLEVGGIRRVGELP